MMLRGAKIDAKWMNAPTVEDVMENIDRIADVSASRVFRPSRRRSSTQSTQRQASAFATCRSATS